MNVQLESWNNADLGHVQQMLAGHEVPWMRQARHSALGRFYEHGFPTRREEEWKYTDVSQLAHRATLAPDHIPPDPTSESMLLAWALSGEGKRLMAFVNGHYAPGMSTFEDLPEGVVLASLAALLDDADSLPQPFFDAHFEHTVFSALNTAFATDGAVLYLPPGVTLDMPIYLLFIASGHGPAVYPRNIVIAGEGARATVIEHYLGALEVHSFTDAITQLSLGTGAEIEHCKLLQDGPAAAHIAGIHAEQAAGSRFVSHSFAVGGHLGRNDITVRLLEPGCQCTLNGLYLLDGKQHMDHHTRIDHLAPDGTSREYYRGVLDGASHGVFNGKVVVHPGATGTDAHQSNHNLLLSRQAEVDTKPQLEIFADAVRCTHGATVGQLDEASLFYLRSRGIDAEAARSLLVYGFANDIVARVSAPDLRARIEQLVLDRLPQGDAIKELL